LAERTGCGILMVHGISGDAAQLCREFALQAGILALLEVAEEIAVSLISEGLWESKGGSLP
jgi:hypothetical protein